MRVLAFVASAAMALPLAAQPATFSIYGHGCYDQTLSFYELFIPGTFDLGGTSAVANGWTMVRSGTGYMVLPLAGTWHQRNGINLGLGDEAVSPPLSLPFSFPFPGGAAADIVVSSNGFVYLGQTGGAGCCGGSSAGLLTGPPRIAPLWMNLDPTVGTVEFDYDPVAQAAWVTWRDVQVFGTPVLVTFQIALWSWGQVDVLYRSCANPGHVAMAGWSLGGNARDPGSIDLSASIPFTTAVDRTPLALGNAGRPITGTTMTLVTADIPPGTPFGAFAVSQTQIDPGQNLAPIGMPDCLQFVGPMSTHLFFVTGPTANLVVSVPNAAMFVGQQVYAQSAVFSPGANALGVIVSNGAALLVGTF